MSLSESVCWLCKNKARRCERVEGVMVCPKCAFVFLREFALQCDCRIGRHWDAKVKK